MTAVVVDDVPVQVHDIAARAAALVAREAWDRTKPMCPDVTGPASFLTWDDAAFVTGQT